MGFLQRLLGKRFEPSTDLEPAPRSEPQSGPEPAVTLSVSLQMSPLTKVAGTTTFAAAGAQGLVWRRGVGGRGVLEDTAVLQRDPTNPVDPNAVAVLIDGEHVGALPSPYARATTLDAGAAQPVPVQVAWAESEGKLRVEAWVWLGEPPARWTYSADNLPPMTTKERAAADHARTREMVADAVAGGGHRAAQFQSGMVQGVHYLELVEPIKQLKREARLDEALELCYAAIQGAEGDPIGGAPAPWYTEQAAIVLRKLGDRDGEIKVLERYLAHLPAGQRATSKLGLRLAKLTTP
ncbi:hypothetical protein [Cellulosimicrobium sp. NPDC057127]|uniref:hypothetical protein n=1 Tax=Cellulosimicrobium sp. NPDC057127 TaxID=3346026 RepID=UPI003640E64D